MNNYLRKLWNELTRREQLQLKGWLCLLGLVLLFLLLGIRLLTTLLEYEHKQGAPEIVPEHIPVVEILSNVWIMEVADTGLQIFRDGTEENLYFADQWEEKDLSIENVAEGKSEEPTEGVTDENVERTIEGTTDETADRSAGGTTEKTTEKTTEGIGDFREQIADIELTDGQITGVWVKKERIHGKVLSAGPDSLEIEGYGKIPLAADYKGYRIYKELIMCSALDLPFGYDFADFCVENGSICAILMTQETAMEYIRVLVKTSDYGELLHQELVVTADCDFLVRYSTDGGQQEEYFPAGTELTVKNDSRYWDSDRVHVIPSVLTGKIYLNNVRRNCDNPGYRGHLELQRTEEGIAVVNELFLEEYLYSVVPSEMPASYPEEALKAQAISARTYAYGHMLHAAYPQYGAHVDDSTSYQVYNNIREQESTTTAVKETYGQLLLTTEKQPAQTYYYSTSCGMGSDAGVWSGAGISEITYLKTKGHNFKTAELILQNHQTDNDPAYVLGDILREESAFSEFIRSRNAEDFEVNEPWYRWNYYVEQIDPAGMLERMKKRYGANEQMILTLKNGEYVSKPIKELDRIKALYISGRGSGGVAAELTIETAKNTYKVLTEYNIRYVLCSGEDAVVRQDGTETISTILLPSAFVVLETENGEGKNSGDVVGYKVVGGGFGHGVGMSQNGAKNMAAAGYIAEEILGFYYEGCTVQSLYVTGNEGVS